MTNDLVIDDVAPPGLDKPMKAPYPKDHKDGPFVARATLNGGDGRIGRGEMFGSVSGLSPEHVREAVQRFQQAAVLALHHAPQIHYTQGAARWQGIDEHKVAIHNQFPTEGDCSSIDSWAYWNALYIPFKHTDTVNGEDWEAGYSGTLLEHGRAVSSPLPGDSVIYGTEWPGEHVALYTGGGLVVSHGSEAGPLLLPVHYRPDVLSYRRYI